MRFSEICNCLDCTEYNRGDDYSNVDILNITAGDLMSEVLVFDKENLCLVTSLNSEQVLRTANIVDADGVVLVNAKIPNDLMVSMARDLNITLLATPHSMFDTCAALHLLLNEAPGSA